MTDYANTQKHNAASTCEQFSSNCVRLSAGEWALTAILVATILTTGPVWWRMVEPFAPSKDYRLSSESSDDYWHWERYCSRVCEQYDNLVLGDSAMRGFFVDKDRTLSHYLNELTAGEQFANLAVDGMHPAAMTGLLRYYGKSITHKDVIIQMNPLWMSSRKQDLSTTKEFRFHHPDLIPQFDDAIACYKASLSDRFSTAVQRQSGILRWAAHVRRFNLPAWTLEHPYASPCAAFTRQRPSTEPAAAEQNRPWYEMNLAKRDMPFVELENSLQWRFFRETVQLLQDRRNRVFVLVGPFNEHMLAGQSVSVYERVKTEIGRWLSDTGIPHLIAEPPPSDCWRDASHALAPGYRQIAEQLFAHESFHRQVLE